MVDAAVVAHAGEAAEDRADQGDDRHGDDAMMAPVVAVLPLTGSVGRPLSRLSALNWLPATRPRTARTTATMIAHSQTPTPCFSPLNRAIRPAT